MTKVLVTGGAGFIGSHVVDACLAAGYDVCVVDDLSSGARNNLDTRAKFIEIDIRSETLTDVFASERPEVVMHLAAQIDVRKSLSDPLFDADVNVLGTINVLECCVRHGAKKLIYASTGGAIYGEPAHLPASEDTPPAPICHYGVSKLAGEHYVRLYNALHGLRYTILRFPNVYGPRQQPEGEAGVCSIFAGLMLAGKQPTLYGHGEPIRDYVYVGDIARGCLLAMTRGDGETLNLGSGKGTTVRELFDLIARYTGYTGGPRLALARPGEVHAIYTTGDRANTSLGWVPEVTLADGLERTVDHIRHS
ncbi:MAG: NAD-dependent epimerase/dehydratase family protein [Candidatus Hydrogenedentota bacterium]